MKVPGPESIPVSFISYLDARTVLVNISGALFPLQVHLQVLANEAWAHSRGVEGHSSHTCACRWKIQDSIPQSLCCGCQHWVCLQNVLFQ